MNRIALIGTPNVGKTSVFNRLTNASQKVANYSVLQLIRKLVILKYSSKSDQEKIEIIDLPGILSLTVNDTEDVKVTHNALEGKYGVIDSFIFIVDSLHLDRDLLLVQQTIIKYPNIPRTLLLNFQDELLSRSGEINEILLSKILKTHCISISALKNWVYLKLLIELEWGKFLIYRL